MDAITSLPQAAIVKPKRPRIWPTGQLRVRVERQRCQGHARCLAVAPELFELDELGNSHEIGDGIVSSGLETEARLAQANCPEMAIEVKEST